MPEVTSLEEYKRRKKKEAESAAGRSRDVMRERAREIIKRIIATEHITRDVARERIAFGLRYIDIKHHASVVEITETSISAHVQIIDPFLGSVSVRAERR